MLNTTIIVHFKNRNASRDSHKTPCFVGGCRDRATPGGICAFKGQWRNLASSVAGRLFRVEPRMVGDHSLPIVYKGET